MTPAKGSMVSQEVVDWFDYQTKAIELRRRQIASEKPPEIPAEERPVAAPPAPIKKPRRQVKRRRGGRRAA